MVGSQNAAKRRLTRKFHAVTIKDVGQRETEREREREREKERERESEREMFVCLLVA